MAANIINLGVRRASSPASGCLVAFRLVSSRGSTSVPSAHVSVGRDVWPAADTTTPATNHRSGPSYSTNAAASCETSGRPYMEAGQPTAATHPWLIGRDELTPFIPAAEYMARRAALASTLPVNGAALLGAAPVLYMAGVIPYPYRQHADFFYLTGITQPGTAMLLERMPGEGNYRYSLFVPEASAHVDRWSGWQLNAESAMRDFGAHDAYCISQLPTQVAKYLERAESRGLVFIEGLEGSAACKEVMRVHASSRTEMRASLQTTMHRLRWVKSPNEVKAMAASASLAARSMRDCISGSHPGVSEHNLQCHFEHVARRAGAQRMAYPPVVAGGAAANIIHYSRNDQTVPAGQLLTMDAGCELHGYASDITRSWPVSGQFSSAQRDVYEAVLEVHRKCEAGCVVGNTLRDLHSYSVAALCEAIRQFGLSESQYRRFYPHALGHWLGLDTHDAALVSLSSPMQAGVVLTIEPGLYFPDTHDVPRELRGAAIRLEDDILIQEDGPIVLTKDIPIDPDEVSSLVGTTKLL